MAKLRLRSLEGVNNRKNRLGAKTVHSVGRSSATITHAHTGATTTVIFTAKDRDGNATAATITVANSDNTKATIAPTSGASPLTVTATGVAAGTTTITATSGGKTTTCVDTVT